jgi:HPt (histidine-containing phosphotransfer) domain-containing protein
LVTVARTILADRFTPGLPSQHDRNGPLTSVEARSLTMPEDQMSDGHARLPALDVAYLEQQTFGDNALARELLTLFSQQCERLGPAIRRATPMLSRADAAHTLKGAARAVGASRIAALTDAIEVALAKGAAEDALAALSQDLDQAFSDLHAVVAAYLARD